MPALYWLIFEKHIRIPVIEYSSVSNEFLFIRFNNEIPVRTNSNGDTLTKNKYEQLLPLIYTNQLIRNGNMPDSIMGVHTDVHAIHFNTNRYKYTPKNMFVHNIGLYPLFESESDRVNLELPPDFFRINNSIEFITASTNDINLEKSKLFNQVFINKGFSFPAKIIAGIPTTRKSIDEGYFIVDNTNKLFHLKMTKGQPYFEYIQTPDNMKITHIECIDFKTREFYAIIFDSNNNVYVLIQDIYSLIKLPITDFEQEKDELRISENIFFKNITTISNKELKVWIIDDLYNTIAFHNEILVSKEEAQFGKIFSVLFPFEIITKNASSSYKNFKITFSKNILIILTNFIFTILYISILLHKKQSFKKNFTEIVLVILFGFYGFVGSLFFPNKN